MYGEERYLQCGLPRLRGSARDQTEDQARHTLAPSLQPDADLRERHRETEIDMLPNIEVKEEKREGDYGIWEHVDMNEYIWSMKTSEGLA